MSYDATQVAFVDTETLGLDPDFNPVWEVAVITERGERSWFQRVGPKAIRDGHPVAKAMTGFDRRYRDTEALDPFDSIDRFNDLVKGRHLVGACPWFDSERMHRTHRAGLHPTTGPEEWLDLRRHPWHYHLIDVETLVQGFRAGRIAQSNAHSGMPTFPPVLELPWDSRAVSLLQGIDPDEFQPQHTALADARWAKALFESVYGGPS